MLFRLSMLAGKKSKEPCCDVNRHTILGLHRHAAASISQCAWLQTHQQPLLPPMRPTKPAHVTAAVTFPAPPEPAAHTALAPHKTVCCHLCHARPLDPSCRRCCCCQRWCQRDDCRTPSGCCPVDAAAPACRAAAAAADACGCRGAHQCRCPPRCRRQLPPT